VSLQVIVYQWPYTVITSPGCTVGAGAPKCPPTRG
jgi:hypothetical protein